ncbi:SNARE associated Golgi protein [Syntrophomonas zehnderi OL-4]|uniref:TVP38/TMEM64 family membrane protein n=1 Tax=Syntrophomonas zehnderi OL-4 TaxID=690567 RepID=A0A0E4GBE2_9FIRM|nr:TVP38/TMEM64 family protein [Syntrophomonas zehnderi]CFX89710.1 SNARE associated Golgi protein [Syntrophomonas zehnderi OL-4]
MRKLIPHGVVHGICIILFLALLIFITIDQGAHITKMAQNPVEFKAFLQNYGIFSILVFIAFQTLQVLVAAIPGELLQLAGGFAYGTWEGAFYSLIGISIGSTVAFFIARVLGYPFLKMFVPRQTFARYKFLFSRRRGIIIIFILFLIPGFPKDILSYLAGITPLRAPHFIISSTAARFPGILVSSYIGANLQQRNITEVVIAASIAVVVFVLALIYRRQLIGWAGQFSRSRKSHSNKTEIN